jgi:type VI secretion system secreted protein VgrG
MEMLQHLNESASAAKAWLAELDHQRELITQTLIGLNSPGILASAPRGLGIVSGRDMQFAARRQMFMTAGNGLDIGVMKRLTAAAGEAISLFAAKLGIRVVAAKGKVQVQAQDDALELQAMRDVLISASHGDVMITASKGITLGDGSGACIKIAGGKIELASPSGEVHVKGNLRVDDPAGGNFAFPGWDASPLQDVNRNTKFGFSE